MKQERKRASQLYMRLLEEREEIWTRCSLGQRKKEKRLIRMLAQMLGNSNYSRIKKCKTLVGHFRGFVEKAEA